MATTTKERAQVLEQLYRKGISYQDAHALRRISMTLHRWFELECGDGNDYSSWSIERDEHTNKPYTVVYPNQGKAYRRPIADRETGAYKRLALIMEKYPALIHYVQTDCRGASLYILTVEQANYGGYPLESIYNRGVAIY
jgi:hypothetical protein